MGAWHLQLGEEIRRYRVRLASFVLLRNLVLNEVIWRDIDCGGAIEEPMWLHTLSKTRFVLSELTCVT